MRLSITMSGWPEGFNMHNHRCNRWQIQIAQLTLQCNQHESRLQQTDIS